MSAVAVKEVVRRRRAEYEKATKKRRAAILNELAALTDYHRKSLVRLLSGCGEAREPSPRPGRAPRYALVVPLLRKVWAASFFACGKRLQAFMPEALDLLIAAGEINPSPYEERLLRSMSSATVDRLLTADRNPQQRGLTTTRAGALLRSQIPIRTFAEWTEQAPGFLEIDLVAHCGETTKGEHLWTLDLTDVLTGWTALVAMKGKGQQGVEAAIETARRQFPFPLRGLDCDNDSVFINANVSRYCEKHGITFTRSRPYKKNDQCHVEQKNGSVVRQFIGYRRLETEEELALLQAIYVRVNRYHNFYWPMMRLTEKERHGSKVRKRYDRAKTPYRRLLAIEGILEGTRSEQLRQEYADPLRNPAALLREITDLLEKLQED